MKKIIAFLGILSIVLVQSISATPLNPKIQGNIGYAFPMPKLSDGVKSGLSFGGSATIDTPFLPVVSQLELSFSTATFAGKTDSSKKLTIMPLLISGIFDIPIPAIEPVLPFAKIGGGSVFESSDIGVSSRLTQIDPGFILGIGASVEVIPQLNIGFETSYLFIWQTWFAEAKDNASLININLGIRYKF